MIHDDKVTGLLIGGLRSPCPNSTYVMNDSRDNLGMYLTMYDGIFENEQEKEMFYTESMLHRLADNEMANDELHECRISRIVARIREILNNFGKLKKLPRSMMCVDENLYER